MTIKNPAFFNRKRDCYRQAKIGISFAAVAYRWILSAEDSHLFSTGSRFPDLRIGAGPRLLTDIAMTSCGWLPVYSDRIVRDFHPIPFYPPMAALSGLCSCVRFSGSYDSTLEKFVKYNLEKGQHGKISARMGNWARMEQHFLQRRAILYLSENFTDKCIKNIRLLWQMRDPAPNGAGHASLFVLNKGIR